VRKREMNMTSGSLSQEGHNCLFHAHLTVYGWKYRRNGTEGINHKFNGTEGNSKKFMAHKELIKIFMAQREFTQERMEAKWPKTI
jgi:hypothetical protein